MVPNFSGRIAGLHFPTGNYTNQHGQGKEQIYDEKAAGIDPIITERQKQLRSIGCEAIKQWMGKDKGEEKHKPILE